MSPPVDSEMPVRRGTVTTLRRVATLTAVERDQLFQLLGEHFQGVERRQFDLDLDEKPWVFVVSDRETGEPVGFSTLMRLDTTVDGEPVVALFSGDTVIRPEYANDRQFIRAIGQLLFSTAAELPESRVYFLLLTCTYRSYRFLPGFFREYYPRRELPTPVAIQQLMGALTRLKFPNEYDATAGVVRPAHVTPVREDRVPQPGRHESDPDVEFFLAANPGYAQGHFLVCLTPLGDDNLNPLGLAFFGRGGR